MSDAPAIPGLSVGRNVHYVLPEHPLAKQPLAERHRAAIISDVTDRENGTVGLHVLMQPQDVLVGYPNPVEVVYCNHSAEPESDSWHFLEYVP